MKRIITLILLPILFFTMVGQAIPQQGTSNLLRPLATYESPFSNGNLGDRFRRAWPGNEGFEKFLELNPQIRGLHETIPRIFHDLRSRVVPAWEITLNNPVVISNANNQDRAGRTFTLFTMTHKGLNAGRVLVVRDVRGFVEAIGVENTRPGFNTEGMNYFAQIAREDPLWQAIQGKAPRELSSDVSVDRENFVYLPWLMSEDEAEDLRDLVAGDALLTHLFQSDKMPFADINSRGVIMLASTGRWDGFKDDESGVIMRSVAVAHNDISTLAHEMGHFFLDEVARDPKEAKKIEKYVNSGRRDKTFLRNLIAGHYLAPGPYASEHRKEIVCQETLLPLFEAFLDRTGVAVVDKAYTYLETGDVEVFCDLGLLPDWARPGFVGEIVPPEYFALLQVRAEERGLEIF
ncbi:MAG: hypothetical protein ABH825_00600, partial [Candidatus Omnitrophota bacterium]